MPKRKNTSDDSTLAKRRKVDSTSQSEILSRTTRLEQSKSRPDRNKKGNSGATTPETSATRAQEVAIKTMPYNISSGRIIHKLAPPRPFPTVPTSVSSSGPKSAHKEGRNLICITRHTPLAVYLRRCKKVLVEDGYKVLHLHAMGAAIPHLLTLTVSLPPILPFSRKEIKVEVRTGTIEVMDEIIPDDEDEDLSLRIRGKGGVSVVIQIGEEGDPLDVNTKRPAKGKVPKVVVIREQDQEDDMDQAQDGNEGAN